MRPPSFQPIGNMTESRCEIVKVFPRLFRPQGNNCRQTEAEEEEDYTESELHIEIDLVTIQLEALEKILFESPCRAHVIMTSTDIGRHVISLVSPNKDLVVMRATNSRSSLAKRSWDFNKRNRNRCLGLGGGGSTASGLPNQPPDGV